MDAIPAGFLSNDIFRENGCVVPEPFDRRFGGPASGSFLRQGAVRGEVDVPWDPDQVSGHGLVVRKTGLHHDLRVL